MRKEAALLAALDHPHIIGVHDLGTLAHAQAGVPPGTPYLVLERIEGGDLVGWRGVPPARVRTILCQLLSALAHTHARGFTQGDIGPANVLVAPDGSRVWLTDFAPDSRGTPGFCAPEGPGLPAADLFSVGALARHLLGTHDSPELTPVIDRLTLPAPLRPTAAQVLTELGHIPLPPRTPRTVGASLWTLRRPPLVGRDAELQTLLTRDQGLLLLAGPPAAGTSRLARELVDRLREQGVEAGLLGDLDAPPDDHPAGVQVATTHLLDDSLPPGWARHPRVHRVAPLDRRAHQRLVRGLLPLTPDLTARLIGLTRANPLFAVDLVDRWVRAERLVDTSDGLKLEEDSGLSDELAAVWRTRLRQGGLAGMDRARRGLEFLDAGRLDAAADELLAALRGAQEVGDVAAVGSLILDLEGLLAQPDFAPDDPRRIQLLEGRARLDGTRGRLAPAWEAVCAAKALADQHGPTTPFYARAHHFWGLLASRRGLHQEALAAFDRAEAAFGEDTRWVLTVRKNRASTLRRTAPGEAEALFRSVVADLREFAPDSRQMLSALQHLATTLTMRGEVDEPRTLLAEVVETSQSLGIPDLEADAWSELGEAARRQGDLEEAERCYRAGRELRYALGGSTRLGDVNLALVLQARGNHAEARARLEEALPKYADEAVWHHSVGVVLAASLAALGEWDRFEALAESMVDGPLLPDLDVLAALRTVGVAAGRLGREDLSARAEATAVGLEAALNP